MKITDSKGMAQTLQPAAEKPAARNGGAMAPAGGESIHISAMSHQLSALETRLSAGPAFDAGKVDEIKQAIREGRFSINPDAIADKLLANVEELLRKTH